MTAGANHKPLAEDEVYVGAKAFLRSNGWRLMGGQPPSGCDHLPVIEVKAPIRSRLGSKGAYKPDLIAFKAGLFMLVECKPQHNETDARKLRGILDDEERVATLYEEMRQRHLFARHGLGVAPETFPRSLCGALAHSGPVMPQADLYVLLVSRRYEESRLIPPTTAPVGAR